LDKAGTAYISTPCFNGSAAENHINEMTYQALGGLLEDLGFAILEHYGTFASISDYQKQLMDDSGHGSYTAEGVLTAFGAFNELRSYYDTNVLATIFAPLYPQFSRNVLWVLSNSVPEGYVRKFQPLKKAAKPWSSSEQWETLGKVK
jgi:hypothetical protein